MRVNANGTDRELADGATLAALLDQLGTPQQGVAVAVDGALVPRASWASTALGDGARVEILTAVQGG